MQMQDEVTQSPLRSAEYFDSGAEEWVPIAPMGYKRTNFGFVALNGCLYAIGAWNADGC